MIMLRGGSRGLVGLLPELITYGSFFGIFFMGLHDSDCGRLSGVCRVLDGSTAGLYLCTMPPCTLDMIVSFRDGTWCQDNVLTTLCSLLSSFFSTHETISILHICQ